MAKIFCFALLLSLTGCWTTQEVEVDRDAIVISHFYFGIGWLAIYQKQLEYELDAEPSAK